MNAAEMNRACEALLRHPTDELVRDTGVLVFDARTIPSIAADIARGILTIAADAIAAIPVEPDPRDAAEMSVCDPAPKYPRQDGPLDVPLEYSNRIVKVTGPWPSTREIKE